jgi:hypothetical protein
MSSISPITTMTGYGATSSLSGYSDTSLGTPGLLSYSFPSPGIDPDFMELPAASSFQLNNLLGWSAGLGVNINFGPTPSTLGLSPGELGEPYFSTPSSVPSGGGNPIGTLYSGEGWDEPTSTYPPAGYSGYSETVAPTTTTTTTSGTGNPNNIVNDFLQLGNDIGSTSSLGALFIQTGNDLANGSGNLSSDFGNLGSMFTSLGQSSNGVVA